MCQYRLLTVVNTDVLARYRIFSLLSHLVVAGAVSTIAVSPNMDALFIYLSGGVGRDGFASSTNYPLSHRIVLFYFTGSIRRERKNPVFLIATPLDFFFFF